MPIANRNAPMGFRLIRSNTKEPVRRARHVAAARVKDLMKGDPYTLDASGQAVKVILAGTAVRGVVEAVILAPKSADGTGPESQDYIPAASAGDIIGIEDNNAQFEAQITTIAVTDLMKLVDIVDPGVDGNQTLAQSRAQLDGATLGTGDQFRVSELLDSPGDNAFGAFARVVCNLVQAL